MILIGNFPRGNVLRAVSGFGEVIASNKIIVCVGSGGVGKTTTAASFAIEAARQGKRTLVLTIDPAKRLANSLGLNDLGHEVQEVPQQYVSSVGGDQPTGTLHAMMLDQRRAFDEMVEHYATDPEAIKRIFANPVYQQIAGTLTGSLEYAALTKLQSFDQSGDYDLIVLDTPPTAHALDFLDAPRKLSDAIDSPAIEAFRVLRNGGNLSVLGKTSEYIFKMLAKFVGSAFLNDITIFFREFNDILGGFKVRADEVLTLLHRANVTFVIVTSPDPMSIREALFFHRRLLSTKMAFAGFVVNKVHKHTPVALSYDELSDQLASIPEIALHGNSLPTAAKILLDVHTDLQILANADQDAIRHLLQGATGSFPVHHAEVPFFKRDVYKLEALVKLREYLFISHPPIEDKQAAVTL